jgi:hypothetical protein
VVITSHCCQVIEDVAHRALLLDEGKIAMDDKPSRVISSFLSQYKEQGDSCEWVRGEPILIARDVMKKYMTVDRGSNTGSSRRFI